MIVIECAFPAVLKEDDKATVFVPLDEWPYHLNIATDPTTDKIQNLIVLSGVQGLVGYERTFSVKMRENQIVIRNTTTGNFRPIHLQLDQSQGIPIAPGSEQKIKAIPFTVGFFTYKGEGDEQKQLYVEVSFTPVNAGGMEMIYKVTEPTSEPN